MKNQCVLLICICAFVLGGCQKGRPAASDELLSKLRSHMDQTVSNESELQEVNTLVKDVVEQDAIGDLRRFEVQGRLGKGDPCSRHPDCLRLGFEQDDWVYTVGQQPAEGVYFLPMLFVGFDRQGHHSRSHYIMRDASQTNAQ